jgi:hypothetical protein
MPSIDAVPVELWMEIISHMSRNDLLQFRLCSSRTLLPIINQVLFEHLYIIIGVDEGRKAASRMLAVSRSNVTQHVRVLQLQVECGRYYSGCLLSLLEIISKIDIPITKSR